VKESKSLQEELARLPIVVSLVVRNNEETVLDCLRSTSKLADITIVTLENSTDSSAEEIDKHIRRDRPNNFFVFDLTRQNPWPNVHNLTHEVEICKSLYKNLNLTRSIVADALWVAVDPRVLVYENARQIIYEEALVWKNTNLEHAFLKVDNLAQSFMPFMRLKSSIFPGPETLSREKTMMYAKIKDQIGLLEAPWTSRSVGVCLKRGES